jgi:hypothetical protein
MPKSEQSRQRTFQTLVLATGVLSMVVGITLAPPDQMRAYPLVLLVLIIAVLEFIPIKLYNANFSLIHIILFLAGLLYGTGSALIVNLAGVLSAVAALLLFPKQLSNFLTRTIHTPWVYLFDFSLSSARFTLCLYTISSRCAYLDQR